MQLKNTPVFPRCEGRFAFSFLFIFPSVLSPFEKFLAAKRKGETTVFTGYLCYHLGNFMKVVATSASCSGFREWVSVSDHVINLYLVSSITERL